MANQQTVWENQYKKMELTDVEYAILKVAEDERAGREIGAEYYGTHTRDESLLSLYKKSNGGRGAVMETLDNNGIIAPYGHPFRFIVTEKGRLLMRIYELEHAKKRKKK